MPPHNIVDFYTEASIALVGISDYYYSVPVDIYKDELGRNLNVQDPAHNKKRIAYAQALAKQNS